MIFCLYSDLSGSYSGDSYCEAGFKTSLSLSSGADAWGESVELNVLDGKARRVPHSAFLDCWGESPGKSVEVRALILRPDDVE